MSNSLRDYAGGDEKFLVWLKKADSIAQSKCGLSIFDLADRCWRDAYDNGSDPRDEVMDMLADEGMEGGD